MTNEKLLDSVDATMLSLMYPLEPVQLDLLEAIWLPMVDTAAPWPVWDYVARTVYRQSPPVIDPGALLSSLPVVAGGIQRSAYGLVWRSTPNTFEPMPDEKVGLTIAGLCQLSSRRPEALVLADNLAKFIGYAASWERELVPEPERPTEMTVDLDSKFVQLLAGAKDPRLNQLAARDVGDVLQKEYAPLNMVRNGDGSNSRLVLRMGLARYHGVTSATDYLECIAETLPTRRLADTAGPLLLAQMLDHLSLVLRNDSKWEGKNFVDAPDLRSAATLVMDVADDVQFRDRMSALAAVLGNLKAPPIPADVLAKRFNEQQQPSLMKLRYWLELRLEGLEGRQRALVALDDVREAMRLRVEGQHPTPEVRARAAQARARLGLPEMIFDWSAAWDLIRGRVAEAFDIIRQEVSLAP